MGDLIVIVKSTAKNTSHIFTPNEIILYTVIVLAKKGANSWGKKLKKIFV